MLLFAGQRIQIHVGEGGDDGGLQGRAFADGVRLLLTRGLMDVVERGDGLKHLLIDQPDDDIRESAESGAIVQQLDGFVADGALPRMDVRQPVFRKFLALNGLLKDEVGVFQCRLLHFQNVGDAGRSFAERFRLVRNGVFRLLDFHMDDGGFCTAAAGGGRLVLRPETEAELFLLIERGGFDGETRGEHFRPFLRRDGADFLRAVVFQKPLDACAGDSEIVGRTEGDGERFVRTDRDDGRRVDQLDGRMAIRYDVDGEGDGCRGTVRFRQFQKNLPVQHRVEIDINGIRWIFL